MQDTREAVTYGIEMPCPVCERETNWVEGEEDLEELVWLTGKSS